VAHWLFGPRLAWHLTIPALVVLALIGLAIGIGLSRYLAASIKADALAHRTDMAEDDAYQHVIRRLSPEDFDRPMTGDRYAEMDRFVREELIGERTVRIKIWNRDGTVMYSDELPLVGRTFPIQDELAEALAGLTAAEVSDLSAEENVAERQYGRLLEIYVPLRFDDSPEVVGAYETYSDYAPVAESIANSQRTVFLALGAGMATLYLALLWVHRRGVRVIAWQAEELRRSEDLKKTYESILSVLGSALGLRDHATEGHSDRVAVLAMLVAREMGVAHGQAECIGQAAVLHDIGKIGIPDAILLKPGPLTEEEWREMRKHPGLGYEMLKDDPFLSNLAEIVYSHHERYDGTGYPRGLKGEEIPLGARIFAVVDAYDAITSDRPYRRAKSHGEAMEEIVRWSGIQFDPRVVEAFRELDKKGLVEAARHGAERMQVGRSLVAAGGGRH